MLKDIHQLIEKSRQTIASFVNAELTMLYWHVGRRIKQEIMHHKRAEYGKLILHTLSAKLTAEYGRGWSERNLAYMIRFTGTFPEEDILQTLCAKLSWSHFKDIIYIDDPREREFYAESTTLCYFCYLWVWVLGAHRAGGSNLTRKHTMEDKSKNIIDPKPSTAIKLIEEHKVRTLWDEDKEEWFFSIVDVVAILAKNDRPRKYWNDLKRKLKDEGSELSEEIGQLKMPSLDGKMRSTDVADAEQLLRLIQSIPSKKAEPFKLWLAKVGAERIEEIEDPELAFDRAMQTYLAKGYSQEWINQRLKSIEVRKELTDEWQARGMKEGLEYAILTNEITQAWSDKTVKEYKRLTNLKKGNLRDNMSNLELVLNMLAEASTSEISKEKKPITLDENKDVARKGGNAAKQARLEIEKQIGKPIVSSKNARHLLNPTKKRAIA